jgi:Flp pilus assembly protein TadD
MPFDPYALCPGGREKKIRFCCPNMLKEIEQVGRLLESNQTGACLSYIETLEKDHPNCACLTSAKLSVYRSENRWQEALPVAEQFHAREPENPTAAAEYALALTLNGDLKLAISTLVDAFERTKADTVHSTLLHAALQVGAYLLLGNVGLPAIAIGHVLKEIPATAEQANALLYKATAETDAPLLLRDWAFDFDCPENFPGKEAYQEAGVLVRLMRWKQALALLEPLTVHADVWSGIWRNIAAVHFWLMDTEKGCEALQIYASLSNTPFEDAVDAAAIRMLFVPDPLGDDTQLNSIEYTITDADKALEKLLSAPLFFYLPTENWRLAPPPRGAFVILDRPVPDAEATLTTENIASRQCIAFLFGKETDKESRFSITGVLASEQELVEAKLREALGDIVQFPGNVVEQKTVSKTRGLAECRYFIPPEVRPEDKLVRELAGNYDTVQFPEAWLALPLGLFDGKTSSEAAKEPKYTIPLLAAIQLIEFWVDTEHSKGIAQNLRARLGLPALDTITVTESPGEDPLSVLDAYPVWRWYRFDVSKLSTEVLAGGLQIVASMQEVRAAVKFAEELLNRLMDSMPFPVRIMAFESLISAAQISRDIEAALLWIERAKSESAAQNVPDAAWYLHEITLHLMQGNGQGAHVAIQHLTTHYKNDANVMQALQELFMQLGFFNPDGTPSAAMARAMMETREQPAEQGIWTPDGGSSAGAAGASKLWVPD